MLNVVAPRIPLTYLVSIIVYDTPAEDRAPRLRTLVNQLIEESDTELLAATRLQYLRRLLHNLRADQSLIDIAKNTELTRKLNNRSNDRLYQRVKQQHTIPPDFAKQQVIHRLTEYNTDTGQPTLLAIADIMIAGSMRPSEINTLWVHQDREGNYLAEGFAKGRGAGPRPFVSLIDPTQFIVLLAWLKRAISAGLFPQQHVSRLLRSWLRDNYGMTPKHLRAIGSTYIAENMSESIAGRSIAQRIALRHGQVVIAGDHYGIYTTQPPAPNE